MSGDRRMIHTIKVFPAGHRSNPSPRRRAACEEGEWLRAYLAPFDL